MIDAPLTFAGLFHARRDDDHAALLFEQRSWTWREVLAECDRRAAFLRRRVPLPTGRPIHVGILLENVPDFVFWIGAAAITGSVVVGLNSTRRGDELAADIRHTDCDVLITETWGLALLDRQRVGVARDRILDIDDPDYALLLAQESEPETLTDVTPRDSDTLLLLFSSGSTGVPKAVVCSQGRLARLAHALGDRMEIHRETVTYLCMPLFHGNSLMTNLAPVVRAGATVAIARKFSASRLIPDIRCYGATYWNFVGRAVAYALATERQADDADTPLRLAYGTEASARDAAEFAERFGCRVMQGYGASEGVLRINRVPGTPEGSMGLPVGDSLVVIIDDQGNESVPAEFDENGMLLNPKQAIGQMVVRGGAANFEGYYNNPDAMEERVHGSDFWTGDLAYRDADGFLYFSGRTTDWIRVDGENLAVAPIERLIEGYPAVSQAVVYGIPDARTSDQVMATLSLTPGARFDADEFGSFLTSQPGLGTKWLPHLIRCTNDLPSTANGKISRPALREQAWATDDPVWVWSAATREYTVLTPELRHALVNSFHEHGREHLLPESIRDA
ncbi:MAG: steroid-22-oyl-CoA synthetase [Pseudonocardiales bacterium]|jgi:fatty-acyl-CoA synthase|nr:steroid-22-oyl-CoA synthetase [Pseudonocardiales bacterium]